MALNIDDVIKALTDEGLTSGGALPVPRGGRGRPTNAVNQMKAVVQEALEKSRPVAGPVVPFKAPVNTLTSRVVSAPADMTKVATDLVKRAPKAISGNVLPAASNIVKSGVSGIDDVIDATFKTASKSMPKSADKIAAKLLPAAKSALPSAASSMAPQLAKKVGTEVAKKGLLRAGLGKIGGLFGGKKWCRSR